MQNKLIYLQDSLIEQLSRDEKYLREFPFLRGTTPTMKRGCRSCGGGQAARNRQQTYAAIKQAIAGLSGDRKRKMKEMLQTKQLRVIYRTGAGKIIELTF
jgi:hypothetical protein